MEKEPRRRGSNPYLPPLMSELRIVLLGKCGELKSKVGNIILRREAFETQLFYNTGKQQCESVRGLVDGSHVTVINTPDLLHPQLSLDEIDKQLELCASLSDPGPHLLLLVLQPNRFTEKDRDRMKKIMTTFNDRVFEYTMVLVFHEDETDVSIDEQKDSIRLLIEECRGRCHKFNNINKTDHTQIVQFMEQINRVVMENKERYLICEIHQEVEPGEISISEDPQTRGAQNVAREYEPQSQGEKDTREENVDNSTQQESGASIEEPPLMSELRIVLLGRTTEVKCRVGNAVLGGKDFSVSDQCERRRTEVNGKLVTVINTPDLLEPKLTRTKLFHQIETCVSLSAPGPHAFLLVLQDGQFSEDDRKRLKMILSLFSAEAFKYSMVLITNSRAKGIWETYIIKDSVQKVVAKCNKRSLSFQNLAEISSGNVAKLLGEIEQMVRENGGGFLNCEYGALGSKGSSITETATRRKCKTQPLPGTKQKMEVAKGERLNLVVFGRRGAGKTSAVNAILGQRDTSVDRSPSSGYESREGEVCGRLVTVVELPAVCETQPSVPTVSHLFTSLCGPGVHAFLLVTPVGSLTDEDKAEITRIQETFGSRVTDYMMVLFIHETPTAEPVVEFVTQTQKMQELLKICNERFCIFNNQDVVNNPVVPELLAAVEKMNKEAGSCLTLDMYLMSQLERTARELEDRYNTALEEKDRKIRELEEKIKHKSVGVEVKGEISDCVRIVLVGKTGSGKSATGNTILRRNEFTSDLSSSSVTTRCQKGLGVVAGRLVAVVDTPDLFDTSVNNEQVQEEIAKCISFLAPGPHVFLLVLQLGRITKEEKETLKLIKETFGKMAERFTIVLFTRGDDLNKSIESYIQSSDPMLQKLIHDCGDRVQVFNNKDQSNITQVTELLDKIDMMVQKNGGGCYTNEMFQEAERTIKKEYERILREKEGEMEREKLNAKHEEEMGEMKRRMEEQMRIEEEERVCREKELKDKEENLKKEIEALKKREQEANERREEDEKGWKSQELEWKSKIDEKEREKCRIKEELQRREEEEKKKLETVEKEREELLQKQEKEKREFEEKLAEKRDREEQEKINLEERERREWEQRIKEAEKEKKEILEEMKKKTKEWELQRGKERMRTEEKWKQKEEQEKEWEEKQKKMRDEFEKEKEEERLKRERDKEIMEKDLEEKKRQLKQREEEWEKERKEEREKRYKEDEQRREEERQRLVKLQEEFEKEREEETQRRKKEEKARRAREEIEEIEEDYERKMKEIKSKYEEEARKLAEEFNDLREKHNGEYLALNQKQEDELIQLKKKHKEQLSLGTERHEHENKSLNEKIEGLKKKHREEIEALNKKLEGSSCVVM